MYFVKSKLQILVTFLFIVFLCWWFSFQHVVTLQGKSVQWFGGTYGIIALFGAIIGIIASLKWGGYKTVLGKSLLFFSLGLFAQEAGQLILTYYIYGSKIQIPYPSWGDVAYFTSTLSYLLGAYFLTKALGVMYSLKSNKYKIIALIVPLAILLVSFMVFIHGHQYDLHKPLTVFLDSAYPIGDAIYISLGIIAFLLSNKTLGGVMRPGILILIAGLSMQYISDFTFLYQSSRGTYLSGRYDDLFYLISYFITATAMVQFLNVYKSLRNSSNHSGVAK